MENGLVVDALTKIFGTAAAAEALKTDFVRRAMLR
jgi:hypothetical protein